MSEHENHNKLPVVVNGQGALIQSVEDAYRVGSGIVRSNLFQKKYRTPEQAMVAILAGRELGLGPIASCRGINVIEGQPAPGGDLALSLVRRSGKMRGFKTIYTGTENQDDWTCTVRSQRVDEDEPVEHSFSVADAKRAGLWGRTSRDGKPLPWSSYPKRMLFYRALGFHLRDQYGDVLMGAVIAEELHDYQPGRPAFEPEEATGAASEDRLLAEVAGEPEPEVVDAEPTDEPAPAELTDEEKQAIRDAEIAEANTDGQGSLI